MVMVWNQSTCCAWIWYSRSSFSINTSRNFQKNLDWWVWSIDTAFCNFYIKTCRNMSNNMAFFEVRFLRFLCPPTSTHACFQRNWHWRQNPTKLDDHVWEPNNNQKSRWNMQSLNVTIKLQTIQQYAPQTHTPPFSTPNCSKCGSTICCNMTVLTSRDHFRNQNTASCQLCWASGKRLTCRNVGPCAYKH